MPTGDGLALQMNGEGLTSAVLAQLPTLLTASADAHFEFVNDAPVIVPGTPGTTLDPKAVAAAVSTAAVADNRSATVDLVQADPSQSTAALEALGVKEIVSEFSTPLTSEPRRTVNITNGASKINGTLIKPGETFSLTEALGPIDAAHGFVEAGAIVSGEHTDAWGGGLSQVSTTTYNAGFLAGFEDIEHKPHSEWFARYPEGREATIFTGTLDMRWKNNTPYGALVQAWVADNRVYVRVWGTKYWTVESITSPRSNVVQPTTVYSQSPTCEASSAGNPGFTVTVTRKTSLNGELKKTESNTLALQAAEQDRSAALRRHRPPSRGVDGAAARVAAAPAWSGRCRRPVPGRRRDASAPGRRRRRPRARRRARRCAAARRPTASPAGRREAVAPRPGPRETRPATTPRSPHAPWTGDRGEMHVSDTRSDPRPLWRTDRDVCDRRTLR